MDSLPHPSHTTMASNTMAEHYGITNKAAGEPCSMQSTILEAGAAATQVSTLTDHCA